MVDMTCENPKCGFLLRSMQIILRGEITLGFIDPSLVAYGATPVLSRAAMLMHSLSATLCLHPALCWEGQGEDQCKLQQQRTPRRSCEISSRSMSSSPLDPADEVQGKDTRGSSRGCAICFAAVNKSQKRTEP